MDADPLLQMDHLEQWISAPAYVHTLIPIYLFLLIWLNAHIAFSASGTICERACARAMDVVMSSKAALPVSILHMLTRQIGYEPSKPHTPYLAIPRIGSLQS